MTAATTDATTERIRDAALGLFAERGYGNTTIEHISTAAQVGVATIYRRWPDKASIANELYADGLESMAEILAEPADGTPREQFVEIWNRVWHWAVDHRDMLVFVNASAGAPWLAPHNVDRKAAISAHEVEMYGRLQIDAAPDFAASLIAGALASVLALEPDIEPGEVGARLWRALNLAAD